MRSPTGGAGDVILSCYGCSIGRASATDGSQGANRPAPARSLYLRANQRGQVPLAQEHVRRVLRRDLQDLLRERFQGGSRRLPDVRLQPTPAPAHLGLRWIRRSRHLRRRSDVYVATARVHGAGFGGGGVLRQVRPRLHERRGVWPGPSVPEAGREPLSPRWWARVRGLHGMRAGSDHLSVIPRGRRRARIARGRVEITQPNYGVRCCQVSP